MKAVLYVATSLNGMMTRGKTDSDWVSDEDEAMFAEICADVGCILVGRKTFEQYQGIVYPVPDTLNVVLSSQPKDSDDTNIVYASSLKDALAKIAAAGYARFIVVGGAHVMGQCLQEGLVDTVYLSLHPYIFSDGLSMIGDFAGDLDLKFRGVKHQSENLLLLEYGILQ